MIAFVRVFVTLAVLLIGAPALAAGLPMMNKAEMQKLKRSGEAANVALARLIEESLQKDPGGGTFIRGSECTTPVNFLRALQEYHPGSAVKSVAELPAFVRSLQHRKEPSGKHRMSRMLKGASGCSLDLVGWEREFRSGEGAWYDANTNQAVLADDCTNVTQQPAPYQAPPRPLPVVSSDPCGDQRAYRLRVFAEEDVPPEVRGDMLTFVEELKKRDPTVDSFENAESFARRFGPILLKLHNDGKLPLYEGPVVVSMTLFTGANRLRSDDKLLGDTEIRGVHLLSLSSADVKSFGIRTVVRRPVPLSPVKDSLSDEREVHAYPKEWLKPDGKPWCAAYTPLLVSRRMATVGQ